jgi:hypothetical protein
MLGYQSVMHAETKPGGRLHKREGHTYSLHSQDFLIAATIVCVDLYNGYQLRAAGRDSGDVYIWGVEKKDEMMTALRLSKEIWDGARDCSIDAWKASGVMGMMLEKLNMGQQSKDSKPAGPVFEPQDEKQNAAMTLGLLSSGVSPVPNSTSAGQFGDTNLKMGDSPLPHDAMINMEQVPAQAPSPFSMFGPMNDMQPLNLDWVSSIPFTLYL